MTRTRHPIPASETGAGKVSIGRRGLGLRRGLRLLAVLAAAASGREIPIVVLHTTDLHGRIVNAIPESNALPEFGLLRIASHIRAVRREHPNALYIDCGDTIQGTPESLATKGRIMTDALARLRCDAWVPGNHEFDWGVGVLRDLTDAAPFPVVAANIAPRPGAEPPLPALRPWTLREVDGVRIAIVGVTHPGIPGWLVPHLLGDAVIGPAAEAVASVLPEVRAARPDVMILACHLGPRGDARNDNAGCDALAARFPEFDLVLGAHTHEAIDGWRFGPALYAQAGAHGSHLGRVDLIYDSVERRVTRKTGALIPVDASTPPDGELARELGPQLDRAHRDLSRVLAQTSDDPLARARGTSAGDEPVARLLRAAILAAVDADAVIHGVLSTHVPEPTGITLADVWRMVPYENRIGICHLTATEIREILDEILAVSGRRPLMGVSGLVCEIDPDAGDGRRVLRITLPDGRAPHPRQRFRVAFNSHTLASGGRRHPNLRRIAFLPTSRLDLTPADTRQAVVEWLSRKRTVTADDLAPPGYRIAAPHAPGANEPP